MALRIGIDVGGTFTDLIAYDESTGHINVAKTLSTPPFFVDGCIKALSIAGIDVSEISQYIGHASTVADNAIIERKLPSIALITTSGFEDVIFMGRLHRERLYELQWDRPAEFRPIVKRRDVYGVDERVGSDGTIIKPLNRDQASRVVLKIINKAYETVAVCFINSYRNPTHEELMKNLLNTEVSLRGHKLEISISSEIIRTIRELPRLTTTVIDAAIKPILKNYLGLLKKRLAELGFKGEILIMKSDGGVGTFDQIAQKPVYAISSGVAAGVIATKFIGELYGLNNLISFDMGGTTCKTSVIIDGQYQHTTEFQFEWDIPIALPMIDMIEIGAGGGSVAWVDKGGMLRVGPISAGASPGPACYGLGGTEPTITDANLLLGRLGPDTILGDSIRLDVEKARESVSSKIGEPLGLDVKKAAHSILSIAELNMSHALKKATISKGIDPSKFTIVAFGGAGPMHICNITQELPVDNILVPIYPGVFSAFGMLSSDIYSEKVFSYIKNVEELDVNELNEIISHQIKQVYEELKQMVYDAKPLTLLFFKMKYEGESFGKELIIQYSDTIDITPRVLREKFENVHMARYGFIVPQDPVTITDIIVKGVVVIDKPKIRRYEVDKNAQPDNALKQKRIVFFENEEILTPVYERAKLNSGCQLSGPAILEEYTSTIIIPPGFNVYIDEYKNVWMGRT
jgi:N-methylhydantoinase A